MDHIPTSFQPRMISENAYCTVICSYFVNILCWLIFFLFFFGVENPFLHDRFLQFLLNCSFSNSYIKLPRHMCIITIKCMCGVNMGSSEVFTIIAGL